MTYTAVNGLANETVISPEACMHSLTKQANARYASIDTCGEYSTHVLPHDYRKYPYEIKVQGWHSQQRAAKRRNCKVTSPQSAQDLCYLVFLLAIP